MGNKSKPGVLDIAIPTIGVLLLGTISSVLMIKIAAPLGAGPIAIVTAGQRLVLIWSSLFLGLGAATTALVSRAWGSKDEASTTHYTRYMVGLGVACSLLVTAVGAALASPLASYFNFVDETAAEAKSYFRWLALFAGPQLAMMILSTASRATGDARTPLYIGLLANAFSVALAYCLGFGYLGLPALGLDGLAIGWGLGFVIASAQFAIIWVRGRGNIKFFAEGSAPSTDVSRIVRIAAPASIEPLIVHGSFLVFLWFVARYGNEVFAAYGVGLTLMTVPQVIGYGFSMAAATLAGMNLGAGKPEEVITDTIKALRPATLVMVALSSLVILNAELIATAMVDDQAVTTHLSTFLIIIAIAQIIEVIDQVISGALRGTGNTATPLRANVIAITCVRFPLAAYVLWQGMPAGFLFAVIIAELFVKTALLWVSFQRGQYETA